MNSAGNGYSMSSVNTYKEQEIGTASPEKCVLHLYDAAIQSCAVGQQERAGRAVAALIDALDFEVGGEVAGGLFRLYEYCLRNIHEKKYDDSQKILKELRDTWQMAIVQHHAA